MAELAAEVEQQLADMTDNDFAALTARVRPPKTRSGSGGRAEAEKRFGTRQEGHK